MQEALDQDEQQVKLLQHEQGQLVGRQTDLEHSLEEIEAELDVCFAAAKEDLARKLIKRRLEAQRFSDFLSRKRKGVEGRLSGLTARLEENRSRLEGMRQKAELLAESDSTGQAEEPWAVPDFTVREEDVEVAFLREKQQRSRS